MMLKLITVYKRKLINLYGKINLRQLIKIIRIKLVDPKEWSVVNGITGRSNSEVPISSLLDPQVINMYFQSINTDSNYTDPVPLTIPEGTRLPKMSIYSVVNLLLKQKPTAAGPDDLPYWFWRDYAYDLAPVITKIFNTSFQNGVIPDLWKLVSPLTECSQLRPISLTNIIMQLFERTIYINELLQVMEDEIHKNQFAYRKNHSSTTALIKAQHTWIEWLYRGAKMVRVFSFDFKKAFDSVPHDVLCDKIKNLPINPYVINWMIKFLKNRYQRVCVDGIKTEYPPINRGVPQGTVLGPLLFSIMTNDIKTVLDSDLLVKFADDLNLGVKLTNDNDNSVIEIENIIDWSGRNRMELNFTKTWEIIIHGNSIHPLPEPLPKITRKSWLKILGVTLHEISGNWDNHFN